MTFPSALLVCHKVTRALPLPVSCLFFLSLTPPLFLDFFSFFFFLCDLSLSHAYYLSLVSVSVSPVLTPPESEKADSEERVSLKVCSQHSSVISASFFLIITNAFCQKIFLCLMIPQEKHAKKQS